MNAQEFVFETAEKSKLREALLAMCPIIFRGGDLEKMRLVKLTPQQELESFPSFSAAWWSMHFNPGWISRYWAEQFARVPGALFPDEQSGPPARVPSHMTAKPMYVHWQVCAVKYVWNAEQPVFSNWETLIDQAIDLLRESDCKEFANGDQWGGVQSGADEGPFQGCEGSVRIGYRAHLSGRWGDEIRLSRCHIYHPK